MKNSMTLAIAAVMMLSTSAIAEEQKPMAAAPTVVAEPTPAADAVDKSGTDPTKFLRTVTVKNEFNVLPGNDDFFNTTSLVYIQPFADGTMNLRAKVPFVATDVAGEGESGLGDLSLRYNWLAKVTPEYGLLVGVDSTFDTASERYFGRDRYTISPLVTYAMFLNNNAIFAPTYQHNFSIFGNGNGPDVNESVIDLYFVYTADDKKSWITVDPAITINWDGDPKLNAVLEVQFGRTLGKVGDAALNAYVAPSVGIGDDRPINWGIEIGFSLVGF